MLRGSNDLKVFDSIVERIPVYMVHMLHPEKRAPKPLLHNPTVLFDRFIPNSDTLIAPRGPFRMPVSVFFHPVVSAGATISTAYRRRFFALTAWMRSFHGDRNVTWNIIAQGAA